MEEQSERYQRLASNTNAIAQQAVASGEVQGYAGIVRVSRDAMPDFFRKHWTTTCFVPSGRITLVYIGTKDNASRNNQLVDLAAEDLEGALAMKHPLWSEGWLISLQRDWWAYKHSMQWLGQRNYCQSRKASQKQSDQHKKEDHAQDTPPLDVSSWTGRWAILQISTP